MFLYILPLFLFTDIIILQGYVVLAKVLLVTNNQNLINEYQELLQKNSFEFLYSDDRILTQDMMKSYLPDIILLDYDAKNIDIVAVNRDIKTFDNTTTILLMPNRDIEPELMKNCNAFLQKPFSDELLLSTINAHIKIRKNIEKLSSSNRDLAQSFYQLRVLHDISSQFAGTLDREELINIMFDGIDKSLSFGLAWVLYFKNEKEPVLIISSLYNISDRLLEAIKLRAVLNYKSLFDKKEIPFEIDINNLKVEKRIKETFNEYDFSVLMADNMIDSINISDNFFGFIEIFRNQEFQTEDVTCFHSIIKQLSLPLQNAMLYEKQEQTNIELKKMEHLKSEFISIVSHELRTPLTSIQNSLDIILGGRAGEISETISRFINMGRRNVENLKGIINDLLDLSKIEAGKMNFNFENIKINQVVEYVKNSLDGMAKEKNINLVTTLEDNFADIYADASRLEQILTNLVSNALKFTNENGKIEIRTKVVDASEIYPVEEFTEVLNKLKGKYLQVLVKDNGIGISRENLKVVFNKFSQIEGSMQRKVGGTGLGLSIVKQLLEAHNGVIWCNSKPEKGSSFYFAIPIANNMNKFLVDFKVNLKKAKEENKSVALVSVDSKKNLLEALVKDVIKSDYLKEYVIEDSDDTSKLLFYVDEGNKIFIDLLKKQIRDYINMYKDLYSDYDIIFGYGIYPIDALDDFDLMKKLNKVHI